MREGRFTSSHSNVLMRAWSSPMTTAFLFSFLLTLPFLDKPFHIDDSLYLSYAHHLAKEPFNPAGFQIVYGNVSYDHPYGQTHLPLLWYCYAGVIKLIPNAGERTFHCLGLVFFIAFLLSFHRIASFFLEKPAQMTVLAAVIPASVLTFQSLMPDGPALTIGLAGLAVLIPSRREQVTIVRQALGTCLLIASWLTAYQMFVFTVLSPCAAGLSDEKRRVGWFPVILSSLVFLGFQGWSMVTTGIPHVLMALQSSSIGSLSRFDVIMAGLSHVGGAFIAPVVLLPWLLIRFRRVAVLSMVPPLCAAIFWTLSRGGTTPMLLLLFCFTVTGGGLLIIVAGELFRSTITTILEKEQGKESLFPTRFHDMFCFAWILGFCFFVFVSPSFGAVRYTWTLFPPILLVLGKWLERSQSERKNAGNVFSLMVMCTFLLSLSLAVTDYQFASCYRSLFHKKVIRQLQQSIGTVYLIGKFGFQHYGEEAGITTYVRGRSTLKTGDFVLESTYCGVPAAGILPPSEYDRLQHVFTQQCRASLPLSLVNYQQEAGYYCSLVGPLPWVISRDPLEEFTLYSVRAEHGDGLMKGKEQEP